MDNYDVLKFKTYYQYNFDNIESQDFLNLFHSYLKHETVSKDINLNKFESNLQSKDENIIIDSDSSSSMEFDDQLKYEKKQLNTGSVFVTKMDYRDNLIDKIKKDQKIFEKKQLPNQKFNSGFSSKTQLDYQEIDQINESEANFLEIYLWPFVEQASRTVEPIRAILKIFSDNKSFFEKMVEKLNKMPVNTHYSGEDFYKCHKESLKLENHMYPIHNQPNGNCLFNSFSIMLFKHQNYYSTIKLCSIYILIKYRSFFEDLMKNFKYAFTFDSFLEKTCRRYEFGTEINVLSISILLNLVIISYNTSKNRGINNQLIFSTNKDNLRTALIGLSDIHFFPILTTESKSKCTSKINRIEFLLGQEKLVKKYF